jgi:galacturan 1,4-alpha-galacturonidase
MLPNMITIMSSFLVFLVVFVALVNSLATPVLDGPNRVVKRASCTPTSAGDTGTDDVPSIEAAIVSCGNGGTIVIPAGKTYAIRSTLSFTGCSNCDFQIEGILKASDDLTYWGGKTAIFLMSGITTAKVRSVTGTGLIDGNGQAAYDYFATDSSYQRPTLWYITGSTGITISNLKFRNAPNVFHSATGSSKNIIYSSVALSAASSSTNAPKNTDGWDIGPASYVSVIDATVSNQDDCVAFKPGANYVTVDTITCSGSHGLSVGSLGRKAGTTDTVSNIYVSRLSFLSKRSFLGFEGFWGRFRSSTLAPTPRVTLEFTTHETS